MYHRNLDVYQRVALLVWLLVDPLKVGFDDNRNEYDAMLTDTADHIRNRGDSRTFAKGIFGYLYGEELMDRPYIQQKINELSSALDHAIYVFNPPK